MTGLGSGTSRLPEANVAFALRAIYRRALLRLRQLLEESQLESTGSAQTRVHRPPRSLGGLRHQLGPRLDQPGRSGLDVQNLEGHADLPVGHVSYLDLVDHPALRRIGKLQRGPTGVENRDTRVAAPLIGRLFWQPQYIPI